MRLSDLDAVLAIEQVAFPTPWTRAGYEHELRHNDRASYVVMLGPDEEIVGYGGQWLIAGEAHISIVAVAPSWRGRGLGAWLLLALLTEAQDAGCAEVLLEVRAGNEAAQQLYRRYHFQEVGRRRGYYKDTGEDALLMTLQLAAPDVAAALARQGAELEARVRHVLHPPTTEEP